VSFKVKEMLWDINGTNITHYYSSATLPTPLTPTIEVSPGATVSPSSGTEQNNFFKDDGIEYVVTAEDRVTTKKYTVKAIRTKYSDCKITSFRAGGVIWEINDSLITYSFPSATKEGSLIPSIDLSPGAKISPLDSEAQDFFNLAGVKYTVTSEDGNNKKVYIVRARKQSTDCDILSFVVDGEEWEISNRELSITHVFPEGVGGSILIPSITIPYGATIDPPSGIAQNFFSSAGVKYTVKAEDTLTQKIYTVKARTSSSASEIVSFRADGVEWNIDGTNITYTFSEGTVEGYLAPTISLSPGSTISPPASEQQNFFAAPVTYTVTAEDGFTQILYTVKAHVLREYDDRKNWVVAARNGNHGWNDGVGTQTLWTGGYPMLVIDDDIESGWHSALSAPFPQVLIIDMKASKEVSKISGVGGDLYKMEIYLTNDLSIAGYTSHTIDWTDEEWWLYDYNTWYNPLKSAIPETVPASWGSPIVEESLTTNNTSFTFTLPEPKQGQFLILRFTDNNFGGWAAYTSVRNVKVFYTF
jgi:hypothetical protein